MNYGFIFLFVVQKGVCIGLSLFLNYPYTTTTTTPLLPPLPRIIMRTLYCMKFDWLGEVRLGWWFQAYSPAFSLMKMATNHLTGNHFCHFLNITSLYHNHSTPNPSVSDFQVRHLRCVSQITKLHSRRLKVKTQLYYLYIYIYKTMVTANNCMLYICTSWWWPVRARNM
jgi:hypothetical protein